MEEFAIETEQLFELCDREKKGYLVVDDLRTSCPQLDDEEIAFIFKTLDLDGSGKIERKEFIEGFKDALGRKETNEPTCINSPSNETGYSSDEANTSNNPESIHSVDSGTETRNSINKATATALQAAEVYNSESDASLVVDFTIPCQDDVLLLYEQLQTTGMGKLLSRFEKIVGNFCKELKERKDENLRLQHVYESERQLYNRRMLEVENEIDQQILQTEKRIREEERKRLSWEKEELRLKLEAEMAELKENVAKMKQIEESLKSGTCKSDQTIELKNKLKQLSEENENLKSNLAESHIEMALIKSELLNVKSEYESTRDELMSDSEVIMQAEKQSQNLQRQLQLLYDANKKLHDTNDSLRGALCQRNVLYNQIQKMSLNSSSTSLMQAATDLEPMLPADLKSSSTPSIVLTPPTVNIHKELEIAAASPAIMQHTEELHSETDDFILENVNGTPERTFRIVMCGDAAVGKSSIVHRIIKGSFSGSLPSTLGVDFYVKTVRVDGKVVAIQLWDTAGQERFRSLCQSYFRRADGAILVYDCVVERTFLRIREWIDIIKESTLRPIPIMLCGNKTDLRRDLGNTNGCVTTKDGEAVAAAFSVIFAECSALNGTNVDNAFYTLARELMATEDVEVKSTGVTLTEKKSSSCCGRR